MELWNSRDLVDLWEAKDGPGKLHISYGVYLDPSSLSIYGVQGREECIIVSLETIFLLYQEWAFFSPTPTLQNCGSIEGKCYFWPISQVITRLERIGDESINNLTTKKVVCLSVV
jgi:hypothetical protein